MGKANLNLETDLLEVDNTKSGVQLTGMGLATVVAIVISIVFMIFDKFGIMIE